jgi:hypothetical protein
MKLGFFPPGASPFGRSLWREFIEARAALLLVLSLALLPSELLQHGAELGMLLRERPRRRSLQLETAACLS